MMTKRVISVGDLVLDLILSVKLPIRAGQHQGTTEWRAEPGGAGNFMVAARRMGLDVLAVGAVGDDNFGQHITAALQAEGIDTSGVVATEGASSTLVMVLTDRKLQDHSYIGAFGDGPDVPYPQLLDEQIATADALFVQGHSFTEQRIVPITRRAIEAAAEAGVRVYLDVGPFMREVGPAEIKWIIARTDVIFATEDEIRYISGGLDAEAAPANLLEQKPEMVVIKRNERGCSVFTSAGQDDVPGFAARVVDAVGAGDCFDAAFIAGQLHGMSLHNCALLANAAGAASVMKMGAGRNVPTCNEVKALLANAQVELALPC